MDLTYEWRKGFWTRSVRLFRDGAEVGRLRYDTVWRSRATGEIDGWTVRFSMEGMWSPKVLATGADEEDFEVELGLWRSVGRAASGLRWSTNAWNSRWEWTDSRGASVVSGANDNLRGTRGTATVHQDDGPVDARLLLLSGLYVNSRIIEGSASLLVVLVVWWWW